MRASWRRPIRLRLTLVYAVVLVATCAALLALNYGLLYHGLYRNIHGPDPDNLTAVEAEAVQAGTRPSSRPSGPIRSRSTGCAATPC